ncbi:thiol:disulfide interchange protein [Lysinibacillus sp. 2017]|uniref:peroxiredoxin family protein n=1 Tax=unclassified Lysinibacillus TaxID=2636778 RepID=UPI000D52A65C|nr:MULTISPECIES: TlpA disulfide reductase family protein [unclassified Lysinibacillus]AWE08560.1 thiol:disulfide interchange protein [Lysinibacillus sp. 2017]TGN35650.1 TlpA family protein disulfide reductase [Lysinibacillus sp. S2017]
MKKWLTGILVVVVVIFVGFELMDTFQESKDREPIRTMQATDFSLPTLTGKEMSLSSVQGKVVILNFWASWCEPCNIEMPHLQSFYEKYQTDVEILAINVTSKDSEVAVKKFVDQYDLTFPILLDASGDISTMYGAFSIPMTIILNRNGEIEQEIVGPVEEELLEKYIQPSL